MIKIIKKNKFLILFLIFILLWFFYINSSLTMINLPTGDFIESVESPTGEYILNSYKYSGGATVDWSLRVEVVNTSSKKSKNIYYVYHENDSDMKWIDNETVEINGIVLNIHKDFYRKYS